VVFGRTPSVERWNQERHVRSAVGPSKQYARAHHGVESGASFSSSSQKVSGGTDTDSLIMLSLTSEKKGLAKPVTVGLRSYLTMDIHMLYTCKSQVKWEKSSGASGKSKP